MRSQNLNPAATETKLMSSGNTQQRDDQLPNEEVDVELQQITLTNNSETSWRRECVLLSKRKSLIRAQLKIRPKDILD